MPTNRRRRKAAPPPPEQTTLDLDHFIEELPDKYVRCRTLGHAWDSFTVRFDPKTGAYDETLRCLRCKLPKTQTLDSHGRYVGDPRSDYSQVPGYLLPAHSGRMDPDGRAALRAERLKRAAAAGDSNRRRLRAV